MRRVRASVRSAAAASAFALASAFVLAAASAVCVAQSGEAARPPSPSPLRQPPPASLPQQPRASEAGDVSEDFELNIAERRITEENFFASTAVGGAVGALDLRVGVALGAERIDVLLRNVRGRVRFRGSLDALRRVLDARRAPAAAPPRDVP